MVGETNTDPLIRTKLHRPLVHRNHIQRPHLLERLEKNRQRPLTLVSAPAGYGKSTLVSDWLDSCDGPSAWLSLDEQDNDLGKFLSYLLAAVETIFPHAVSKTMTLVNALTQPPFSTLAGTLVNELDRIEQSFTLVLDDYHLIKEAAVNNLIAETLKHPLQSFHLVIVGRRDPALPISKLRAQSKLAEIRTSDLRFTVAETETFLNQVMGIQIDSSTAVAVEEKTEGWVTGLRLAALSMRHRGNLDPRLLEPQVDAKYVMEYLFNEVFSLQPPGVNQYLLGTAILDRFCGPLCEAVCLPGFDPFTCELEGRDFIDWLEKENLFLIHLDSEGRWFRYHHLFKKLLLNQLKRIFSVEEINTLHTQASAWFAKNGLIEEALQHALAAGDIETAGSLVARFGHNLMNDQQWPRLERWLGMLPLDRIEKDPELLIHKTWLSHVQSVGFDLLTLKNNVKKIAPLLDKLPTTTSMQIKGHFDALRGMQHYMSADGENALKHLRTACENIPIQHKRARVFANIFRAGANQMLGKLETGLSNYHNEVQKSRIPGSGYQATYLANLCFVYWIDADLIALLETAEHALEIAIDHGLLEAKLFSLYFLGIAYYHQNKLGIAEEKLTTINKDDFYLHPVLCAHSAVALATIYLARGKISSARKACEWVTKLAIDTNKQDALIVIRAFEAEQALRQGDLAVATHWAERFYIQPFLPPYLFYLLPLTLIKIRMAEGTTASFQQAADLLERLDDYLVLIHNNIFRIHVLALQAKLHDSKDDELAAVKKLAEALALAERGSFIRLFVDLGPQMADLLKQLIEQNVAVDYIGRILAAFKEDEDRAMQGESDHLTSQLQPSNAQTLTQPLTNRELQILNLLGQWLQNKEIAAKLFISPLTVKKHLDNIYGKLNVNGRRQAVEKAQRLEILPPL